MLTTSCNKKEKKNIMDENFHNEIPKEQISLKVICDNKNIDSYLKSGWKVINKSSNNVTCSWKTIKANKECNLIKDKGCRLTVPDQTGLEIIYLLERDKI